MLFDPRGMKHYDVAYDIGKLYHSFHGLYDFFHQDLFKFEVSRKGSEFHVSLFVKEHPALKEFRVINKEFPES